MEKETLIKELKDLYKKYGKVPTRDMYVKEYKKSFYREFGNFRDVLKECGFDVRIIKHNYAKEEIFELYKSYFDLNGVIEAKYLPKSLPSYDLILKYWDKYEILLEELGYEPVNRMFYSRYNKEEMIKYLQDKYDEGIFRKMTDLAYKKDLPYFDTVLKILEVNSWKEVVELIDRPLYFKELTFEKNRYSYTDQELIDMYNELSHNLGKEEDGATINDIKAYLNISPTLYYRRFGSLTNLKRALGYNYRETVDKYDLNREINSLKLYRLSLGKKLKYKDIMLFSDKGHPSFKYFSNHLMIKGIKELNELLDK